MAPSAAHAAASTPATQTAVIGDAASAVESDAIRRLTALGRTAAWSECVVGQLTQLNAQYVFESPTFGLGASPEEASAFALCS